MADPDLCPCCGANDWSTEKGMQVIVAFKRSWQTAADVASSGFGLARKKISAETTNRPPGQGEPGGLA